MINARPPNHMRSFRRQIRKNKEVVNLYTPVIYYELVSY